MRDGIAIQVGLHTTIEYLYLTRPNWRDLHKAQLNVNKLPEHLHRFDRWLLYAVDSDPRSIDHILKSYKLNDHVQVICTHIYHDRRIIRTYEAFEDQPFYPYVPTIQPNDFINRLELEHIDALKLDIEGTELELFTYWLPDITPTFIAVETHNEIITKELQGFLTKVRGYEIVYEQPTNERDGKAYTHETHFLLSESTT